MDDVDPSLVFSAHPKVTDLDHVSISYQTVPGSQISEGGREVREREGEGGREGGKEGGREGGREGRREGGRQGGREGG